MDHSPPPSSVLPSIIWTLVASLYPQLYLQAFLLLPPPLTPPPSSVPLVAGGINTRHFDPVRMLSLGPPPWPGYLTRRRLRGVAEDAGKLGPCRRERRRLWRDDCCFRSLQPRGGKQSGSGFPRIILESNIDDV